MGMQPILRLIDIISLWTKTRNHGNLLVLSPLSAQGIHRHCKYEPCERLKKKNPVSNEAHSGISLGNFFVCVFKEALQKIHPKLPI